MAQGFNRLVYEPGGNVPPDFLVDGRIAVEARRLNQHDKRANKPQGLEKLSKPVATTVSRVLEFHGAAAPSGAPS